MYTFASLTEDLKAAGISHSDTLLVHSSMKSIGQVVGGADTVLDVLMAYFQSEGLLVFPELSWRINAENPVFEVKNTASQVGLLPEMFRHRPGVVRSCHPTHSVAAWGKDAREFVAGHEKSDTPCPADSPWGKLLERKAKILFIGTGTLHCNTFLHAVEEWFKVPGALTENHQNLIVIDDRGTRQTRPMRRHLGGHSRYYDKMRPIFDRAGLLQYPKFGDAACFLLECRPVCELVNQYLTQDPQFFTHD